VHGVWLCGEGSLRKKAIPHLVEEENKPLRVRLAIAAGDMPFVKARLVDTDCGSSRAKRFSSETILDGQALFFTASEQSAHLSKSTPRCRVSESVYTTFRGVRGRATVFHETVSKTHDEVLWATQYASGLRRRLTALP